MNVNEAKDNWLEAVKLLSVKLEENNLPQMATTILRGSLVLSILVNPDIDNTVKSLSDSEITNLVIFATELRIFLLKVQEKRK